MDGVRVGQGLDDCRNDVEGAFGVPVAERQDAFGDDHEQNIFQLLRRLPDGG